MAYILIAVIFICLLFIIVSKISKLDKYDKVEYLSNKLGINRELLEMFSIREVNDKIYMRCNLYWIEAKHWKYQDNKGNKIDIDENEELDDLAILILDVDGITYEISSNNIDLLRRLVDMLNEKGMGIYERIK